MNTQETQMNAKAHLHTCAECGRVYKHEHWFFGEHWQSPYECPYPTYRMYHGIVNSLRAMCVSRPTNLPFADIGQENQAENHTL